MPGHRGTTGHSVLHQLPVGQARWEQARWETGTHESEPGSLTVARLLFLCAPGLFVNESFVCVSLVRLFFLQKIQLKHLATS